MKLEDGSGLNLVQDLNKKRPDCKIVMLTGFGNIATAVAAVKAGQWTICQNRQMDAIAAALLQSGHGVPATATGPDERRPRRWEHISASTSSAGECLETARRLRIGVRCSEFSANTLRATDFFTGWVFCSTPDNSPSP